MQDFFGQIGGSNPRDGGFVATSPINVDAGIDVVLGAIPSQLDDPATIPDEGSIFLAQPIPVSGAIVIGTAFGDRGNTRFWIQDANGAIQVFLDPLSTATGTIRVGDEVEFDARIVSNYEGHPQIAEVENFFVLSSGNGVPVKDYSPGGQFGVGDYGKVVRVHGTLGQGSACGGNSTCYPLTYPGGTTTFRSETQFVEPGDCITFVGPATAFPGPYDPSGVGTPQLDTINFSWYFREL